MNRMSSEDVLDSQPGTSGSNKMDNADDEQSLVTNNDGLFKVDTGLIPQASLDEQESELQDLGLSVFNQDDFEAGVMKQVDQALAREEYERLKRILHKEIKSIEEDIKSAQDDIEHIEKAEVTVQQQNATPREIKHRLEAIRRQKDNKLSQIKTLQVRQKIAVAKLQKLEDVEIQDTGSEVEVDGISREIFSGHQKKESARDRMIRLGEMTPFGTIIKALNKSAQSVPTKLSDFEKFLMRKDGRKGKQKLNKANLLHGSFKKVGLGKRPHETSSCVTSVNSKHKQAKCDEKSNNDMRLSKKKHHQLLKISHSEQMMNGSDHNTDEELLEGSDEEYIPDKEAIMQQESDSENEDKQKQRMKKSRGSHNRTNVVYKDSDEDDNYQAPTVRLKRDRSISSERDDADEHLYIRRVRLQQQSEDPMDDSGNEEFEGGLVVPGKIWKKLYKYQKTGVRWLWELHSQQAGGIIGDEMGLGKTIQMIAFLAALRESRLRSQDFPYIGLGPVVIVCPATVMHQWVKEFHTWWPDFRVVVLHSSGSYTGSEAQLVKTVVKAKGILVTSFNTLVIQQELLLLYNWHYIVLDEGHKIRNPDAQITLCCKQFRTPHRIILSGSPIQNNLKELWSLFDFVFPGKLGTLPDFMAHFSVPIIQGGYSNASQVQVETAYKCACVLRDTINPYLLRRMKADVKVSLDLPNKSEQVLFCRLTDEQREVYQEYLASRECQSILAGKYQIFAGLITLRKICNHPDLSTGGPRVLVGQDISSSPELNYGYWKRSGKMVVVEALLKLWKQQGHRVLLFTQSRAMLDLMENFVQECKYRYLRMDGSTSISSRQPLVTQYNKDQSIYIFLLTTRVGGLGVNLTGANRVIIYDPDWNPSTDIQARERAWRIGQQRQVTVYRLLTSGTIEEKIYHRQIFKQFLTNRILKDPKQRRFFKSNDIYELFTLGSKDETKTETSALFAGTGSDVKMPRRTAVPPTPTPKALKPNIFDEMKKTKATEDSYTSGLDSVELEKMRELARQLSRKMEVEKHRKIEGEGHEHDSESEPGIKQEQRSLSSVTEPSEKPRRQESSSNYISFTKNHSSRESKKKKRKEHTKFEGHRIPHLVKSCEFKRPSGPENEDEEVVSKNQDDYVLRQLFKKTGIHGVIKHDKIMDSGQADYALVEAEAIKVAKEAVAALRMSRALCMPAVSGIPTWTGHHGGPSSKPRFGQKKNNLLISKPGEVPASTSEEPLKITEQKTSQTAEEKSTLFDGSIAGSIALTAQQGGISSRDLLTRMQRRQQLEHIGERDATEVVPETNSNLESRDKELMEDIRNFIAFMGDVNGQATTQELLTNFGPRLPPSESAKFKAMLLEICDFNKTCGRGIWRLKQEFR